jgi:cobalamin biosynthetic protein CobC
VNGWTHHGGRLAEARAAFGDAAAPWLDLSTGINPHGWPAETVAIDWRRLPDERALTALETVAADYFGVDRAYVAAVPGSEIGLRLLGTLLPGPARHVPPTYRTHAEMFPTSTPLAVDALAAFAAGTVVLANPNNPDGRCLAAHDLLALHERLRGGDGWLIVDEAFVDSDPIISVAAQVHDAARLIVVRSFGKFFGLAGVRLGFVIAPQPIVARLRSLLGGWPLSAPAIAIGTAAYGDPGWIVAMRAQLAAEAAALDAALIGCGLAPVGTCPLFRLLAVPDAGDVFANLARGGILTRPFAHDSHRLRIGLPGDSAALARLERALSHG